MMMDMCKLLHWCRKNKRKSGCTKKNLPPARQNPVLQKAQFINFRFLFFTVLAFNDAYKRSENKKEMDWLRFVCC
jgi:hypothetical protein